MNLESNKFCTKATLRDLQLEMLGLLKIIDSVCRKNNIDYWLDAGTLLGAVRHQGYIPWDDDIDISVSANDYHKLLELLNKEIEKNNDLFLYFSHNNVPKFWYEVLATTKILMQSRNNIFACNIDIFPARIISKTHKEKDKIITNTAKYFTDGNFDKSSYFDKKNIKNTLKRALIAKNKFMNYFHSEYIPTCNERKAGNLVSKPVCYTEQYYTYEDIFPLQEIEFEGSQFFSPNNADKCLTNMYGDYMTLPSKSKQLPSHSDGFYFCNSNEFALNATSQNLVSQSKNFYKGFTMRLFKSLLSKTNIYDKLRLIDKKRRMDNKVKKMQNV